MHNTAKRKKSAEHFDADDVLFTENLRVSHIHKRIKDILPQEQFRAIDIKRLILFACKGCTEREFYSHVDFLLKDELDKSKIILEFREIQLQLYRIEEEEREINSRADLKTLFDQIMFKHGVSCHFNFMCCDDCARKAAQTEVDNSSEQFSGFVFFTQTDTRDAIKCIDPRKNGEELLSLWLGFSDNGAAQTVATALRDSGITVHWDITITSKMRVFIPRKRFRGVVECGCNCKDCSKCYGSGQIQF